MSAVNVTHVFKSPVRKVWSALTNNNELKIWYFYISHFVPEEGSTFTFYEAETGGKYLHSCKILTVVPEKVFEHTWEHPSHSQGVSVVKWELESIGEEETRLSLTHSGLENLADAGPEFAPENYEAGWKSIVKIALRNHLYGIEKLVFETDIKATKERVWQALWDKESYTQWTGIFTEGSYYEGELAQGSRVLLLSPGGEGMYSDVIYYKEQEQLIFSHIGYVKDKKEQPVDAETEIWTGSIENYKLTATADGTHLRLELDNQKEWHDHMNEKFPKALQELKRLAEK